MHLFALEAMWSDFYTITGFWIGLLGLIIGVIGFTATLWQLLETKRAAQAAEGATKQTLADNKNAYSRFVAAFASRLLSDLGKSVNEADWPLAAILADDLAELLATIPEGATQGEVLVSNLRVFGQKFAERKQKGTPKFSKAKWNELLLILHARLDPLRAPFGEVNRHEQRNNDAGHQDQDLGDGTAGENEGGTSELDPVGEEQGYKVVLPGSRINIRYNSPRALPDFITLSFFNGDGMIVGALKADQPEEGDSDSDPNWPLLESLYTQVRRHVTGWDKVLSEIETVLAGSGPIGNPSPQGLTGTFNSPGRFGVTEPLLSKLRDFTPKYLPSSP